MSELKSILKYASLLSCAGQTDCEIPETAFVGARENGDVSGASFTLQCFLTAQELWLDSAQYFLEPAASSTPVWNVHICCGTSHVHSPVILVLMGRSWQQ